MKTTWINTNEMYHHIIDAPDGATREKLYREFFIEPWKPMMQMMAGMFNTDPQDDFGVARAWAWLLPDDLTDVPNALRTLEAADTWTMGAQALEQGVARFDAYTERLPFDAVEGWLMIADPARSNPIGRGYTGAIDYTQPRLIAQVDTPNDYNMPRLPGAIVHEFHHLIRLRVFPWDMFKTSVTDYIVHEGMAESFAASIFGEDVVGYYVTDIDDAGLNTARDLIRDGLDKTGFDTIRGYIFGDTISAQGGRSTIGMPDYGGYAIGYRVVQAYLKRTGQSVEEATFVPAEEIVRESSYFD